MKNDITPYTLQFAVSSLTPYNSNVSQEAWVSKELSIIPIKSIGDISPGNNLGFIIYKAMQAQNIELEQGDILVVTQKIVSKAEGNIVNLDDVKVSEFARSLATDSNKGAPFIEVVLRESRRIVRMDHGILICETKHGFICANAGVDESNVNGARSITLLPVDPDHSAQQLRSHLQELSNEGSTFDVAVIISDTWGRPWRSGQVNMAIGVAGMEAIVDYRGQYDPYGYELHASVLAIADELASAAELVMGKIDHIPVALIRGYNYIPAEGSAKTLLRDPTTDMFR
jgi:coenzyme F420-0:L-glutamate ligase/coenzyme F420-1:gamma-L-glutamate ligase